jgi:hypothetical protein
MIGTFLQAKNVERAPLHLYKLEQFGAEWRRLSRQAMMPELIEIVNKRKQRKEWLVHASAADPYNVSKAATSLLAISGQDLFEK